ncbi:MAG: imidazole glycerol phosphate synthase subunit HisH [Anaerovoracaceae bacterium]
MIAIVDYGVGNLFSLQSSLKSIGADVTVTGDPAVLRASDKILLPGVGAFGDAADKLRENGLDQVVISEARNGKPLMGICLGMQLLFEEGEEYGIHPGLGLVPGRVVSMKGVVPSDYKIPHIGWNHLIFPENRGGRCGSEKSPIFKYVENGDCVYFVHSFYATDCRESVIADTEYGALLTAAVQKDNVFGCQFHPEKSGQVGLSILKAFCEL